MRIKKSSLLGAKKAIFTTVCITVAESVWASSSWGNKVSAAATAGAGEIRSIVGSVTTLLMAISAVVFLIGIVNAGYKYKMGDQQAFKSIQNVLIGSLVILLGVGLAQLLFF